MTLRSLPHGFRLGAAVVCIASLAAACGSSAAPGVTTQPAPAAATPRITFPPRPTALPTATLLPTATPEPTPAGGTETATDLASGLRIGSPYRLVANSRNTALTGSFKFDVAGQHIEAAMNGREVWNGSSLVGAAIVMRFTGMPMTTQVFEAAARGGANNVNGRLTYETVLGTRVAYITSPTTSVGMFPLHGSIVMIGGTTATGTKALLASVIKANK